MKSKRIGDLGEILEFIKALFGGVKELGVEAANRYYEWVKIWAKVSVVIAFVGIAFFVLSEVSNLAIFNSIGFFLLASLVFGWLLFVQPLYIFGEQLAKFETLKRFFKLISSLMLVTIACILILSKAPAGTEGIGWIGIFLTVLFGTLLAGTQLTRKRIGLQLVFWSIFFAVITSFSLTSANFPILIKAIDRSIVNNPIFKANELELNLENLTGNGPRIFIDGEPLWWCRKDDTRISGYRCFDQPGHDQTTNEKLFPISQQIINEVIKRVNNEEKRVEQQHLQKATEKRLLSEQQRINEFEEKRRAYIDKYVVTGNNKVEIAIAFSRNNLLDNSLAHQVLTTLPNLSGSHVFTRQVVTDGIFDRIFEGDKNEFKKLKLSNIAERMLIGKVTEEFQNNQAIKGIVNALVDAEIRLLDTATGQIINSGKYSSGIRLGYSEIEAQRKAEEEIIKQIGNSFETNESAR